MASSHDAPFSGTVHDPGQTPFASPPEPAPRTSGLSMRSRGAARVGLTMGSTLAMVISWSVNQSILWAIIHGFLSWIYVVYYALVVR